MSDGRVRDTEKTGVVVVGAGVVGLAIARLFALQGRETVVLESEEKIGTGISSRNSEVVHAGLYYPTGSLKAQLCVRGKSLLYEYCGARSIPHKKIGKLLVATSPNEMSLLETYAARARANGVLDLRWLSKTETAAMEPAVRCAGALLSPSSGIVEIHELMNALFADFENAGGISAFRSPCIGIEPDGDRLMVRVGGASPTMLFAELVINSGGLGAQNLARLVTGRRPGTIPSLYFAIGHYYRYAKRAPFRHLIYPVPEKGGLGIHVTLDMGGRARFGPDVAWRDTINYSFDHGRLDAFFEAIRRYFPAIERHSLQQDYTGIRPKLFGPGGPEQDFMIQGETDHGVRGLTELFGVESPGLTSAMAIAERIVAATS